MPYISKPARGKVLCTKAASTDAHNLDAIDIHEIETAGELQYAIAVMIKSYLKRKGLNYQHCNDIIGALAGAQMEFYRRHVAKYEDQAIERNGDV